MQHSRRISTTRNSQLKHPRFRAHDHILATDGEFTQLNILVDIKPADHCALLHQLHVEVPAVEVIGQAGVQAGRQGVHIRVGVQGTEDCLLFGAVGYLFVVVGFD